MRILTWCAAGLLMTLVGCAGIGGTGGGKEMAGFERPINIIDTQRLHQIDRTIVQDAELIAYIQGIRKRLEAAYGESCNCVVLVDSFGGYEAYTLSHKTIVLASGLVAQAETEDELAAAIAHEMGHVYGWDNAKGFLQDASLYLVKAGGFAVGQGGYSIMLGQHIDDVAKGLIYRQWNVDQEVNADTFALALLAKAGYSIDGLKMAVRRVSEYGAQAGASRPKIADQCGKKGADGKIALDMTACSKKLTGAEDSIYQDRDQRLKAVVTAARQLEPEQRRLRAGPPPPKFDSVQYLFGLNALVSTSIPGLKKSLAQIERIPLPASLEGNVAVSNKLAMAHAMAGNQQKSESYMMKSYKSSPRTAWTFNNLYKVVDRHGKPADVEKTILAAHEEVGLMPALLPIEGYLAERHKLLVARVFSTSRCLMTIVDDQKTLRLCDQFSKTAQAGGIANW